MSDDKKNKKAKLKIKKVSVEDLSDNALGQVQGGTNSPPPTTSAFTGCEYCDPWTTTLNQV
jgi:hypothetical protein